MKSVRLVRAGDIVSHHEQREVVREVLVVVRLSNGETINYEPSDRVDILPPEDISEVESDLAEGGK